MSSMSSMHGMNVDSQPIPISVDEAVLGSTYQELFEEYRLNQSDLEGIDLTNNNMTLEEVDQLYDELIKKDHLYDNLYKKLIDEEESRAETEPVRKSTRIAALQIRKAKEKAELEVIKLAEKAARKEEIENEKAMKEARAAARAAAAKANTGATKSIKKEKKKETQK